MKLALVRQKYTPVGGAERITTKARHAELLAKNGAHATFYRMQCSREAQRAQ